MPNRGDRGALDRVPAPENATGSDAPPPRRDRRPTAVPREDRTPGDSSRGARRRLRNAPFPAIAVRMRTFLGLLTTMGFFTLFTTARAEPLAVGRAGARRHRRHRHRRQTRPRRRLHEGLHPRLFLPQGRHARLHRRGLQPARRVSRTSPTRASPSSASAPTTCPRRRPSRRNTISRSRCSPTRTAS